MGNLKISIRDTHHTQIYSNQNSDPFRTIAQPSAIYNSKIGDKSFMKHIISLTKTSYYNPNHTCTTKLSIKKLIWLCYSVHIFLRNLIYTSLVGRVMRVSWPTMSTSARVNFNFLLPPWVLGIKLKWLVLAASTFAHLSHLTGLSETLLTNHYSKEPESIICNGLNA